jgi:hypothetical protein
MYKNIKYLSYFLLLCVMSTIYADSQKVVGRIEDFDGNPEPLTLQMSWLASQAEGKWLFEAYQQLAEVSKDHHFARVLQNTLGNGVTLPIDE